MKRKLTGTLLALFIALSITQIADGQRWYVAKGKSGR